MPVIVLGGWGKQQPPEEACLQGQELASPAAERAARRARTPPSTDGTSPARGRARRHRTTLPRALPTQPQKGGRNNCSGQSSSERRPARKASVHAASTTMTSHLQHLPHRAGSCACAQDRRGRQDRRALGSLSAAGSGHLPGADTCRERFSQRDLCTPRSEPSALRLARSTSGCFYRRPDESKLRSPDSEKGTSSHCVSRAQPSWGPTTSYARCRQLRKEGRGVGGGAASPRGPYWD